MEQLGSIIQANDLDETMPIMYRNAARGIIYDGSKLLMVYSSFYNDYTFPGGGVENEESSIECLKRECIEEVGAQVDEIEPLFKIVENYNWNGYYLIQTSEFFMCKMVKQTNTNLCDYEVKLGYQPVWLTVDELIELNQKHMAELKDTDYKGVMERELRVLYYLKENIK